jgi:hypothetical protein
MLAWRVCAATSLLKFAAKATPTSDIHHTRGRRFNAEKANLFRAVLNSLLSITVLARISFFDARCYNSFAAKATPTSDIHHTRRRRFNAEKQTY